MTQNVELDISTMEMTIDGEKVTGKCRSEPNYGLNEDLDDRSIRVGMYFHYNLSKSAEEQSVFIGKLKDLVDFKEKEKTYILERLSQLRTKS